MCLYGPIRKDQEKEQLHDELIKLTLNEKCTFETDGNNGMTDYKIRVFGYTIILQNGLIDYKMAQELMTSSIALLKSRPFKSKYSFAKNHFKSVTYTL
jgi:hypothetical protein